MNYFFNKNENKKSESVDRFVDLMKQNNFRNYKIVPNFEISERIIVNDEERSKSTMFKGMNLVNKTHIDTM